MQAHFSYVLLRLRSASVGLTPGQAVRRKTCLELLEEYAAIGEFPHNTYAPTRTPVFADATGRLCAVGYLVAQTAGLDVTLDIANQHRFDYIEQIDDPRLAVWAARHGFEIRELAMIQPSYPGDVYNYPSAVNAFHLTVACAAPAFTVFSALVLRFAGEHQQRRLMGWVAGWALLLTLSAFSPLLLDLRYRSYKLDWMVAQLAVALLLLAPAVLARRAATAQWRLRARRTVVGFGAAVSVVLALSLAPIESFPCHTDPERTTWRTKIGLWVSFVTPLGFTKRLTSLGPGPEPSGTGFGLVVECPAGPSAMPMGGLL